MSSCAEQWGLLSHKRVPWNFAENYKPYNERLCFRSSWTEFVIMVVFSVKNGPNRIAIFSFCIVDRGHRKSRIEIPQSEGLVRGSFRQLSALLSFRLFAWLRWLPVSGSGSSREYDNYVCVVWWRESGIETSECGHLMVHELGPTFAGDAFLCEVGAGCATFSDNTPLLKTGKLLGKLLPTNVLFCNKLFVIFFCDLWISTTYFSFYI